MFSRLIIVYGESGPMTASARIRFKLPSENHQRVVFDSLEPERKTVAIRSKATLQREGEFLALEIKAKDTAALRASLNAYLRWIKSILDVLAVLGAR